MKGIFLTILLFLSGFGLLTVTDTMGTYEEIAPSIPFLSYDNYDYATSQSGIVVVEFWAPWNSQNAYPLEQLQGALLYRVNVEREYELTYELGIEVIPTVFIYKDGYLRHVDETDVSFKQRVDIQHLQEEVYYLYYE